ncbi:peptidase [Cupriavidus sp. BIC8F]|uniref:peptidase n=1 Tax=Cupriavidus sp. BIC8F TaxID=3079014 RepID=UPI0029163DFC|nr:peptidase [Cupriavidus sp. BIC8F]
MPWRRAQEIKTIPTTHPNTSDLYVMAGRWEPPAAMNQVPGADDPMLGSLMLLNRALHRPVPSEVLLEGLPLEGQRLTLPLLSAVAARAGLSTWLVERDLDEIPDTSVPAILLLGKSRPCVLLQRCEHGRFLVALSGWGGGEQEVSRDELLDQYSGYAVFAQPAPQAEVLADAERAQPCRSPGAAMRPSWWLQWERLVASVTAIVTGSPLLRALSSRPSTR